MKPTAVVAQKFNASLMTILLAVFSFACSSQSQTTAETDSESQLDGSNVRDSNEAVKSGLLRDNTITVNGENRTYDLFVPQLHRDSPVVILLHGNRGKSDDLSGESGNQAPYKVWLDIAEQNNIVLVIPNGVEGVNGETGWNDCRIDARGNPTSDDVEFITKLVEDIDDKYAIDRSRVFATGTSNGGHMAIRLAQEASELVAAIGVVAALMPVNSGCPDSREPVSALFINGTVDRIAPYNGGTMLGRRGEVFSADDSVAYWVDRNGLSSQPETKTFDNINTEDDSTVEQRHYKTGVGGPEVLHLKIVGGGHTEPSIVERYNDAFLRIVGPQNSDIEMATKVWSFFSDKIGR